MKIYTHRTKNDFALPGKFSLRGSGCKVLFDPIDNGYVACPPPPKTISAGASAYGISFFKQLQYIRLNKLSGSSDLKSQIYSLRTNASYVTSRKKIRASIFTHCCARRLRSRFYLRSFCSLTPSNERK